MLPLKIHWKNPYHLLASGFGVGCLSKKIPGTLGTLFMFPIYYFLLQPLPSFFYIPLVGGLFLVGIKICGKTADALKESDPSCIVWDEMVGVLVALVSQPLNLYSLIAAFLLFRFFDILKPWPISWIDKHTPGGLGIMLDDVMAGLYTACLLYLGVAGRLP